MSAKNNDDEESSSTSGSESISDNDEDVSITKVSNSDEDENEHEDDQGVNVAMNTIVEPEYDGLITIGNEDDMDEIESSSSSDEDDEGTLIESENEPWEDDNDQTFSHEYDGEIVIEDADKDLSSSSSSEDEEELERKTDAESSTILEGPPSESERFMSVYDGITPSSNDPQQQIISPSETSVPESIVSPEGTSELILNSTINSVSPEAIPLTEQTSLLPEYPSNYDSVCKSDLSDDLSDEQKRWYCEFQRLFGKDPENIEYLKACNCFEERAWQGNLKHVLHKVLNKDCEAYKDAIEILQETRKTGSTKLILRSLLLTRIPTVIESQTQLRSLILCDLDIHVLPNELGSLRQLSEFTCTKCPVYNLPEWIGNLSNLVKLNLSRCRIHSLPDSLTNCTNLTSIDLKYNWLKDWSPERLRFPLLQKLDLEGNPMTIDWGLQVQEQQSPKYDLPKLLALNISQTNITTLPEDIASRLVILQWQGIDHATVKVPTSFGNSLRYLNMASTTLDRSPTELFGLPNLDYLNLPYSDQLLPFVKKIPTSSESTNVVGEEEEYHVADESISTTSAPWKKVILCRSR